mmetsp:Transcript_2780/g.8540  ORF Transcript_2780/g.8540 Transcript_2780/m.8540 type:complete len:200 (-) Transcript_2780:660-1259(-)
MCVVEDAIEPLSGGSLAKEWPEREGHCNLALSVATACSMARGELLFRLKLRACSSLALPPLVDPDRPLAGESELLADIRCTIECEIRDEASLAPVSTTAPPGGIPRVPPNLAVRIASDRRNASAKSGGSSRIPPLQVAAGLPTGLSWCNDLPSLRISFLTIGCWAPIRLRNPPKGVAPVLSLNGLSPLPPAGAVEAPAS